MIVAFNKNELKDGTKRKFTEYSNDLENRIRSAIGGDIPRTVLANGISYWKTGNVVTVVGFSNGDYSLTGGTYNQLATLPSNLAPKQNMYTGIFGVGADTSKNGAFIRDNGRVEVYADTSTTRYAFTMTYAL